MVGSVGSLVNRLVCAAVCLGFAGGGCHMAQVSVTNPIPEMTTVVVAPFFNLSDERTVDGRRFAEAYFSELQKSPGFQVIPVGVAERAIQQEGLQMSNPDDALRLAEMLGADAVVVGAVTDYDPYYPPRIGLQISWYSPYQWTFPVGVECNNCFAAVPHPGRTPATHVVRAQSPPVELELVPPEAVDRLPAAPAPFDPRRPLMSYTRLFDGADADLVANLRDYVELSGDERSGGWEAYLHRSEDFIRFTSHLMIVEMLTLHGGEAKRRFVFALRNHR